MILSLLPDRYGEQDDQDADQNHSDQHSTYHVDAIGRWICNKKVF